MRAPLVAALAALAAAACGGPPPPPPDLRPLPGTTMAVVFLGLELPPPGSVLGGHYGTNTFSARLASYSLGDGVRNRWTLAARDRGEAQLRGAGFRVHGVGPADSDARQLRGVQYGLGGQVRALRVRSSGPVEPYTVEVQTEVSWELLDLGSGRAVFGRALDGTHRATGTLDVVVGQALDASLDRLLIDSLFLRAIAIPRSDPDGDRPVGYTRTMPGRREVLRLGARDRMASADSGIVGRLASGVILLHNEQDVLGTAFIISRDGLAVTAGRELRDDKGLRARLPNGVERPVRVVRKNTNMDVALVQVACPGDCQTVDWEAPASVPVYTNVISVVAPLREGNPLVVSTGRVGGRWGLAHGITLEGMEGGLEFGAPVAHTSSGRVFGLITVRRGQGIVLLLDEVFRALLIQADETETRSAGS